MSRMFRIGILLPVLFLAAGCANMTQQQQRALSGGAIGAGAGALVGWMLGGPALGAALGGATGAAIGAFSNGAHDLDKK